MARVADFLAFDDLLAVDLLDLTIHVRDRQLGIGKDGIRVTATGPAAGEEACNPVTTAGTLAVQLLGRNQEALAFGTLDDTSHLASGLLSSRAGHFPELGVVQEADAVSPVPVKGIGVL